MSGAYLSAAAVRDDVAVLRRDKALWRRVRRFNLPVQLAVAAAEDAARAARDPSRLALLSLAPCRAGSPQFFAAVRAVEEGGGDRLRTPRFNPTLTFHAVDNLALSSLAITLENRAYGLGLGGAPGQAWAAIEVALDRLASGREAEALVVAGDQDDAVEGSGGLGVALLFAREPAAFRAAGGGLAPTPRRRVRLVGVERVVASNGFLPRAHAAAGLRALLERLAHVGAAGTLDYDVPPEDGDGRDKIRLTWEYE